jgi:capping protein (actin filament) muscle Z-line, beta
LLIRSPLSNKYFPELEDGRQLPKDLRELEVKFNKIFSIYSKQYYSNTAITSTYLTDLGEKIDDGFLVTILIKHSKKYIILVVDKRKGIESGIWDSINFVNVKFQNEGGLKATYKLTTTVILQMCLNHNICGTVDLSGSITKQVETTVPIKSFHDHQAHVDNIGKLVEELETTLRNQVEEIYFKKSQEVE